MVSKSEKELYMGRPNLITFIDGNVVSGSFTIEDIPIDKTIFYDSYGGYVEINDIKWYIPKLLKVYNETNNGYDIYDKHNKFMSNILGRKYKAPTICIFEKRDMRRIL